MSFPRRQAALSLVRVLVTLALAFGFLPVSAQQTDEQPSEPGQFAVDQGMVFRASRLVGAEVMGADGATLGEVDGFLVRWGSAEAEVSPPPEGTPQAPPEETPGLTPEATAEVTPEGTPETEGPPTPTAALVVPRVAYILVGAEGLMAVPVEAFSFDPEGQSFMLEIGAQELAEAPAFELAALRAGPDAQWEQDVYEFWSGLGFELEQPQGEPNLVRAGQLDGAVVVENGQEIAVVDELLLQVAPAGAFAAPTVSPAPEMTATPEEEGTPEVTETPEQEETPDITGTPQEAETPAANGTPEEAEAPAPGATPEQAETPAVDATPEEAETPMADGTPEAGQTPDMTPAPGETPAQAETPGAEGTPTEVQVTEESIQAGQQVVQSSGCRGCHSIDGTTLVGPTWQDLFGSQVNLQDGTTVEADVEYLHQSIVDPNAQIVQGFPAGIMPDTYDQQLSEEDLSNAIAYIMSLSEVQVGQAATPETPVATAETPEATDETPEATPGTPMEPAETPESTPGTPTEPAETPEGTPGTPMEPAETPEGTPGTGELMAGQPISMRVAYVVASLSPDLGAEAGRVVIPSVLLDYDRDQRQLRLTAGTDMLQNAPAFNPADVRDGVQADWDDSIGSFWAGIIPGAVPSPEVTPGVDMTPGATPGADVTPDATPGADLTPGATPEAEMTPGETPAPGEAEAGIVTRVSRLTGAAIYDQENNEIGEIQDLIAQITLGQERVAPQQQQQTPEAGVTPESAQTPPRTPIQAADVRYALVTFGGMDGLPNGGLVPVPMGALRPAPEMGQFAMTFTGDTGQLQNIPTFQAEQVPDAADPGWDADLAEFWSGMGFELPQAPEGSRVLRVSTIANYDVANAAGEDLGDVDDVIVELTASQGSLRYALVGFGGFLGIGENVVAVPMTAMRTDLDPTIRAFYLDIAPEQLQEAPTFAEEDIPDRFDPNWDNSLERFWGGLGLVPGVEAEVTPGVGVTPEVAVTPGATPEAGATPMPGRMPTTGGLPLRFNDLVGFGIVNLEGDTIAEIADVIVELAGREQVGAPTTPQTTPEVDQATTPADGTPPAQVTPGAPGGGLALGAPVSRAQIRYAVLGYGGFLGIGENFIVVPFSALGYDAANRVFILDADAAMVDGAPTFEGAVFDEGGVLGWDVDARAYWEGLGYTLEEGPQQGMAYRGSQLTGYAVRDATGEEALGAISDLLIELPEQGMGQAGQSPLSQAASVTARLKYAIVGFGGFLGIGEEFVLIPFEAMRLDQDPQVRAFYLPTNREAFENAPRFSADTLPGDLSPDWDDEFANFWNTELGWDRDLGWDGSGTEGGE